MLEYCIPTCWERMSDEDWSRFAIETNEDATEMDCKLFDELGMGGEVGASGSSNSTDVKVEPEDQDKTKADFFLKGLQNTVGRFNQYEVTCKLILAKAPKERFSAELIEATTTHVKALKRVKKIMKRALCNTDGVRRDMVPSLMEQVQQISTEHESLEKFAIKIGVEGVAATPSKRPRKALKIEK